MTLTRTLLGIAVVIMVSYLLSCVNTNTTAATSMPKFQDCTTCCANLFMRDSFRIEENCASCLMENFKINGYKLPKPHLQQDSTKGFEIDKDEIAQLFKEIESKEIHLDHEVKVFSMLGIYYGDTSLVDTKKIVQPEEVFVVQHNYPNDSVVLAYFNFTQPCPTFCPGGDDPDKCIQ